MASKLPLIAVRLKPHVYEVFARMAELQGRSRSSVVAELLEAVYPPLMRTVALMEAASDAPREVREGLRSTVERLERDIEHLAGSTMGQIDMLLGDLGRSLEGGSTPPSNTGVRFARRGGSDGSV